MKRLKLQRPESIEVTTGRGTVFIIEAATRERVRAAVALDEPDEETASPDDVRAGIALKLEALVGPEVTVVTTGPKPSDRTERRAPSGPLLAELSPVEEMELLWAVWGQATGHDPAASVAVFKKKALAVAMLELASNSSTGTPPGSPTISTGA